MNQWIIATLQKILTTADFKTVTKKFTDHGIDAETVKEYLDDFKKLRDSRDLGDQEKDIDYWGKQSWDTFKEFVDTQKETKSKTEQKKLKKTEGAELVFEDTEWRVYKILTHEAAMLYGSGTKWCIVQEDGKHWRQYIREDSCFYFMISKTKECNNPYYKIAVQVKPSGALIFWNAADRKLLAEDIKSIPMPNYEMKYFEVPEKAEMVDVNGLVHRIDAFIERVYLYYYSNPDEYGAEEILRNKVFDSKIIAWGSFKENIQENIIYLNELLGGEGKKLTDDCLEALVDISEVRFSESSWNKNNELKYFYIEPTLYPLPKDICDEIDDLSAISLDLLEDQIAITSDGDTWSVKCGTVDDHFALLLNESQLDDKIQELEEEKEELAEKGEIA